MHRTRLRLLDFAFFVGCGMGFKTGNRCNTSNLPKTHLKKTLKSVGAKELAWWGPRTLSLHCLGFGQFPKLSLVVVRSQGRALLLTSSFLWIHEEASIM